VSRRELLMATIHPRLQTDEFRFALEVTAKPSKNHLKKNGRRMLIIAMMISNYHLTVAIMEFAAASEIFT
jgi:hypothetical protein